eukprot:Skav204531  [mRNA]  locus=scaffold1211:88368:100028:- [translate_table: standard]
MLPSRFAQVSASRGGTAMLSVLSSSTLNLTEDAPMTVQWTHLVNRRAAPDPAGFDPLPLRGCGAVGAADAETPGPGPAPGELLGEAETTPGPGAATWGVDTDALLLSERTRCQALEAELATTKAQVQDLQRTLKAPVPLPESAKPAPCLHECFWTEPYADLRWPCEASGGGYKYGGVSSDAPFADAMDKVHESETPAVFSKQGAVIGKTRGRKPKTAEPKAKSSTRKRASASVEEPSGGTKRRRRALRQPEDPEMKEP